VLSTTPGPVRPPPRQTVAERRPIVATVDGPATVAAYTVHHGPDGTATDGLLVCAVDGQGHDIDGGARCYAQTTDPDLLTALEAEEWVGRTVQLRPTDDRNMATAAATATD
jgi:acetyl-CoA C-acetyltransferase